MSHSMIILELELSVLENDCIRISDLNKETQEAIKNAEPVKELFMENSYGSSGLEGKKKKRELYKTSLGYIVRCYERTTSTESNGRPETMELEWCCFLQNDIKNPDLICNENWGEFVREENQTKAILISKQRGYYA